MTTEPGQSIEHQLKERERQFELIPLADKILVRVEQTEERTAGGIILPDGARKEKLEGVVAAIGEGRFLQNGDLIRPAVKVGERVIFGKYSGDPVDRNGEKYRVLKESEVLAVYRLRPGTVVPTDSVGS